MDRGGLEADLSPPITASLALEPLLDAGSMRVVDTGDAGLPAAGHHAPAFCCDRQPPGTSGILASTSRHESMNRHIISALGTGDLPAPGNHETAGGHCRHSSFRKCSAVRARASALLVPDAIPRCNAGWTQHCINALAVLPALRLQRDAPQLQPMSLDLAKRHPLACQLGLVAAVVHSDPRYGQAWMRRKPLPCCVHPRIG